jgi:Protein of unknown function (DUF2877)
MRLSAAASSSLRAVLAGPPRPGTWLGATAAALYWQVAGEPGAVALLAHDAVRLPCALLLPSTTAELPLAAPALAPVTPAAECLIGDGVLTWRGAGGPIVVRAVREWRSATVCPTTGRPAVVSASGLAAVRAVLPLPSATGVDWASVAMLATDPAAAVARLLGRGPGLTPAGDDVLAGFVLGARAFGLDTGVAHARIAALAPARTTALSAALLWHAARGECIDEVAAVVAQLAGAGSDGAGCKTAVSRLLAVGHTSGAALATGLVAAAAAARRASTGVAA